MKQREGKGFVSALSRRCTAHQHLHEGGRISLLDATVRVDGFSVTAFWLGLR